MAALLDDFAVGHHVDAVAVANGEEAVGDRKLLPLPVIAAKLRACRKPIISESLCWSLND